MSNTTTTLKSYKLIANVAATDSDGNDHTLRAGAYLIPSGASDKGQFFMVNGSEYHIHEYDFSSIEEVR